MEKEQIKSILQNGSEEFFEKFYETLLSEINNDDEPFHKKGRQLFLSALNNPSADEFFIAICGWSLESLIEKME